MAKENKPNPPAPAPVAKVGDAVQLVLASGKRAPAKVTKVRSARLIDLEADIGGDEPLVITSSPLDETGSRADCWLPVEPTADAKKE